MSAGTAMAQTMPEQTPPIDETVDLLARARNGDREALENLFARQIPLLKRWASGRLPRWARDIADTSDLVQESMLETFKRLDAFEPRGAGALQAYLRQALVNRLRNQLRRIGARPVQTALESQLSDVGPLPWRRRSAVSGSSDTRPPWTPSHPKTATSSSRASSSA
jgi:RNA polymerase sigma-70 factor (ECF subfamily)